MKELIRLLKQNPWPTAEVLASATLINILALADTLFVMIILRRYITYGFDGTLIILTLFTLFALGLRWGLTRARTSIGKDFFASSQEALGRELYNALIFSDTQALNNLPDGHIRSVAASIEDIKKAYSTYNIATLLDAPFILLFAAVIFFIHPLLAALVLIGAFTTIYFGIKAQKNNEPAATALSKAQGKRRGLANMASGNPETMRVFNGADSWQKKWKKEQNSILLLKEQLGYIRSMGQSLGSGADVIVRVGIYSIGAKLVVAGEITVPALIGASLMASYATSKATASVQALLLLRRGAEAEKKTALLLNLPDEDKGKAFVLDRNPEPMTKELKLSDVCFSYLKDKPVLPHINITIPAGGILAVTGVNGSGKTTLLRLIGGLLRPQHGHIMADGKSLDEIPTAWWRQQIMYLPQEPSFLEGSYKENITLHNPHIDSTLLRKIIMDCDLNSLYSHLKEGLDTPLTNSGLSLPVGIRKRMALARTLAAEGPLVLLDEPTLGLDKKGQNVVYSIMNRLARAGKTIVVATDDRQILKGVQQIIDLSAKEHAPALCQKVKP